MFGGLSTWEADWRKLVVRTFEVLLVSPDVEEHTILSLNFRLPYYHM